MARLPFQQVIEAFVHRFGPEEEPKKEEYRPGDFILTHGSSISCRLIRFGQTLRFLGKRRKFAWWNHAAMIVSPTGDIVEAVGAGVQRNHLSDYRPTEYHLVSIEGIANEHDRAQAVKYAKSCVGMPYGWLTIFSVTISLLTGGGLAFGFEGQAICSGLVARALERTDAIFNRSPSHIMPADLAMYFGVQAPPKGTPVGEVTKHRKRAPD